jgi:hypothetical protein
LFGLHLPLCIATGWSLGLNRLKMYAAANISNPLFYPFLLFCSVQLGALLVDGKLHSMTFESFRTTDPWTFGGQLMVGSAALGTGLGSAAFAGTYWLLTRAGTGLAEALLLEEAARAFLAKGIARWSVASWRLRTDPMYRALFVERLLPDGGRFVHWNCGMGLALALLRVAQRAQAESTLPDGWWAPSRRLSLVGICDAPDDLASAREALGEDARIQESEENLSSTSAVLFDQLHTREANEQERMLAVAADSLVAGGTLVLATPVSQGLAFAFAFASGRSVRRLLDLARGRAPARHYRSLPEWTRLLESLGLEVTVVSRPSTFTARALMRAIKSKDAASVTG